MIAIEDALKLTSIKKIDEEINERMLLREYMVGQLYTSVLNHEIYKLKSKRREIENR